MEFQHIHPVIQSKQLLDYAFAAARTLERPSSKAGRAGLLQHELRKVETVSKAIVARLNRSQKDFPSIDSLPSFYNELVKLTMDYQDLKKSLAALPWAAGKVREFEKITLRSMRPQRDLRVVERLRRGFYGRVASVLKQISKNLEFLDRCRRIMRSFPHIKLGFTAAIAGYPNVSKSSLLARLTGASPEIKDYPFTTKRLNLGYIDGIQIMDTPGTFDRDVGEMNNIELQAYLALEHCASVIIFVLDDSQEMERQNGLLARMKRFGKPVIIVHGKSDLTQERKEGDLYVSAHTGENIETLLTLLKKHKADSEREDHKN
jgi:nucleolar GTP-binding protein